VALSDVRGASVRSVENGMGSTDNSKVIGRTLVSILSAVKLPWTCHGLGPEIWMRSLHSEDVLGVQEGSHGINLDTGYRGFYNDAKQCWEMVD
jgi:hypothetical protein